MAVRICDIAEAMLQRMPIPAFSFPCNQKAPKLTRYSHQFSVVEDCEQLVSICSTRPGTNGGRVLHCHSVWVPDELDYDEQSSVFDVDDSVAPE